MKCLLVSVMLCLFTVTSMAADKSDEGWMTIFDGKSFTGWKASENKSSWKIEEGVLICHGPRSHLFYVGEDKPFVNFEFKCEAKTTPGSNAGIYFHTSFQEIGWPKYGYECQVNVSHKDPIKSGSLCGVVLVSDSPVGDEDWHTTRIRVEGRHIVVKINDEVVVDYTEPENKQPFSKDFERRLGSGTFALQAHDPDSLVYFRNIQVRRLP